MEDLSELKAFLSGIAVYGGLEERTLDRIASFSRREEYPQGAVVVREGESGFSMYVVRTGEVVLYRRGTRTKAVRIARLGPGECFGEMAIIDVQPRSATATVERPSVLYSLTNQDLYSLYRDDMPGYVMLIQNLCRELSRRLRMANVRMTQTADLAGDETTQVHKVPRLY